MAKRKVKPFAFFTNVEGQDEDDGVFRILPSAAELIQNLHPNKVGEYTAYNQGDTNFSVELESGANIDSLSSFTTDAGDTFFVCATNGKVLNIDPVDGTNNGTITSSPTAGNPVDFQAFKGSLFIVEKTMSPEKWTGSGSSSAASGWPLTVGSDTYDKPKLVEAFQNRMAFGNFNGATTYPSHIAISNDLDPETFTVSPATTSTNGAVIQVNPGDGQYLTAMKSIYNPSYGATYLVLFKNKSVYALSGDTPLTFNVDRISASFGAINNQCVVEVGTDLLFMDNQNIYSLTGATTSGTLQPTVIGSEKVRETLATLNLTYKDKAWATHLPARQEVWFGIPTGASSTVNKILVYNYKNAKTENQHVWIVRSAVNATGGIEFDNKLYTGTTTGRIRKWFTTSTYNGTGYNWIYRFPYYNFGTQAQWKRIVECFAYFLVRKNTTITVKVTWRLGGNNLTKTFTKTLLLNEGSVYGTGIYGEAVYATTGGSMRKIKLPIIGNGEQVQIEISGTTDGLGPTFLGLGGLVEFGGFSRSFR